MSWGSKGSGSGGPWGQKPSQGNTTPSGGRPQGGGTGGNNNQDPSAELEALLKRGQDSLKNMLGDDDNGSRIIGFGVFIVFVLWLASGIYIIDPDEQGVVLRFGKYHTTTEPGLNYHLPYPIETVSTPRVTTINREEIGFRSTGYGEGGNRRPVPEESLMLTGDKNIVSAQFEVQWRIADAEKFLFRMRSPEEMVRPVAETVMREVMGNTPLSLALSDKRQAIAEQTRAQMQEIMRRYETGIEVFEVNLLAVDAPAPVVDAFIDVLAAQQEKETLRNQAMKYRDGIIPVAQGQVEKQIKDAEGYRQAVVSKATGAASRFMSVFNQYKDAKDVTRQRIYLETMEDVLSGMNKVVVEGGAASGGVIPYMQLPNVKKAADEQAVLPAVKADETEQKKEQ
jgi:membrane protease subunit HflK